MACPPHIRDEVNQQLHSSPELQVAVVSAAGARGVPRSVRAVRCGVGQVTTDTRPPHAMRDSEPLRHGRQTDTAQQGKMSWLWGTPRVFWNGCAHLHSHQQPGKVAAPQRLPALMTVWGRADSRLQFPRPSKQD